MYDIYKLRMTFTNYAIHFQVAHNIYKVGPLRASPLPPYNPVARGLEHFANIYKSHVNIYK